VCVILSIFYCVDYKNENIMKIVVSIIILIMISVIFDSLVCIINNVKDYILFSSIIFFVIYCGLTILIPCVGKDEVTNSVNLITIGIILGILTFERFLVICSYCI